MLSQNESFAKDNKTTLWNFSFQKSSFLNFSRSRILLMLWSIQQQKKNRQRWNHCFLKSVILLQSWRMSHMRWLDLHQSNETHEECEWQSSDELVLLSVSMRIRHSELSRMSRQSRMWILSEVQYRQSMLHMQWIVCHGRKISEIVFHNFLFLCQQTFAMS